MRFFPKIVTFHLKTLTVISESNIKHKPVSRVLKSALQATEGEAGQITHLNQ